MLHVYPSKLSISSSFSLRAYADVIYKTSRTLNNLLSPSLYPLYPTACLVTPLPNLFSPITLLIFGVGDHYFLTLDIAITPGKCLSEIE